MHQLHVVKGILVLLQQSHVEQLFSVKQQFIHAHAIWLHEFTRAIDVVEAYTTKYPHVQQNLLSLQ